MRENLRIGFKNILILLENNIYEVENIVIVRLLRILNVIKVV